VQFDASAIASLLSRDPSSDPPSPRKMGQRFSRSNSVPDLSNKEALREDTQTVIPQPIYDWEQTDKTLTITIHSSYKALNQGDVVVHVEKATQLTITVYVNFMMYQISGNVFAAVADLSVDFVDKRCDVCLTKKEDKHWPVLQKDIPLTETFTRRKDAEIKYYECTVKDIKQVTHDTKLFLVEFPPLTYVSVPVGHHVYLRHQIEGFEVSRPYTPVINLQGDIGFENGKSVLLMIKIYPSGSLTQSLVKVDKGSTIEMSSHDGTFAEERLGKISTLCLVGAGSGFTPMVKLIRGFLENSESVEGPGIARHVKLLCANKTEGDRMWLEELDAFQASSNGRFEVRHALSKPSPEWSGLQGRVTKDMLEDFFPPSSQRDVFVCYCGNLAFNVLMRRSTQALIVDVSCTISHICMQCLLISFLDCCDNLDLQMNRAICSAEAKEVWTSL
jgi:cytochrome-b5 reductase